MPDIDINFKDRIVSDPYRYTLTDNGDGTYMLIPFPGEISEVGTPINAANMNEVVEKHNALAEIVYREPTAGSVIFTDAIPARSTLTKDISIPPGMRKGVAAIGETSPSALAVLVHFYQNPLWAKMVGGRRSASSSSDPAIWTRESIGVITQGSSDLGHILYGNGAAGANAFVGIDDMYITDDKLRVVFRNYTVNARSLDCRIYYDVE